VNSEFEVFLSRMSLWTGSLLNQLEETMIMLGHGDYWLHILWGTIALGMLIIAAIGEAHLRIATVLYRQFRQRYFPTPQPEPEVEPERPLVQILVVSPNHLQTQPDQGDVIDQYALPTSVSTEYLH
jgi:hypothetical protein